MYIIASTNITPVLTQLSSTLPLVYTASTDGTLTMLGYLSLNLVAEPQYLSTSVITEASLLVARPNAVKVIQITP